MGYSMYWHYRVPLSYDLTIFQILGQKLSKIFVGILVQTMTPKGHFEINWPLLHYHPMSQKTNKLGGGHFLENQSQKRVG